MQRASLLLLLMQLLLPLLFITVCHTAVIPPLDNNDVESVEADLRSEAAAFLDEDVFRHVNSPQTSPDVDIQDELLHVHTEDIESNVIYEVDVYSLHEDDRFVLGVPTSTDTILDVPDKENDPQDTPTSVKVVALNRAPEDIPIAAPADDMYPEDVEDLGEDEFILNDDDDISAEDDDEEELVIDPESGMPVFRNKHEDDFNFGPQDIVADDERPGLRTSPTSSSTAYRFNFSNWQFLLGAGFVLLVLKLVTRHPGHNTPSLNEAIASYNERRKQMAHKYEQASARRLPIHIQDLAHKSLREHPPPSFVFPTILEEDEDEERPIDKFSRRASASHILRPSAGGNGRAPPFHHIRHASLSGKYPL